MNGIFKLSFGAVLFIALGGLGTVLAQDEEGQVPEGVQVETRGPVHEAFAEPVDVSPQPGLIVSKAPPEAIEEMPPDEQPEGAVWIAGYWAWDDDRGDFIWVSGICALPPPDYNWMPGYWTQVERGYQWTPGFWMPQQTQQIEYLPPPPATLEVGPSAPQPAADHTWIPGTWYWRDRYVWRPGYWLQMRPDWVWVPAHYIWTPRGVIFTEGYWDYAVSRRGVLFAPVYLERRVFAARGFRYTPTIVISPDVLGVHLFSRPRYTHYYFGDYYAKTYVRQGIVPWFQAVERRRVYDPIIVHREWQLRRTDPRWLEHARSEFRMRQDDKALRPPRTFAVQRTVVQRVPQRSRSAFIIGQPLKQFATARNAPLRFAPVTRDQRQLIVRQESDLRKFRDQRVQWETRAAVKAPPRIGVPGQPAPVYKPQTVRISNPWLTRKTTVVPNRPAVNPPPRPAQPKVETNVRPPANLPGQPPPRTLVPPSRAAPQVKPETKRVPPVVAPGARQRPSITSTPGPRPESNFRPGLQPPRTVTPPSSPQTGLTPGPTGRTLRPGTEPLNRPRTPGVTPWPRTITPGYRPGPSAPLMPPKTAAPGYPPRPSITTQPRGRAIVPSVPRGPATTVRPATPPSIQGRPNPGALRPPPNVVRRPESRPVAGPEGSGR